MLFETKIALVIRDDLVSWQKMNVAAFLASGIAASYPESIGDPYEDASGNRYLRLIGQPMLIYGADRVALSRVLDRALARGVQPALYTEEMFSTTHDAANRDAVRSVERENLDLVGLAIRAERKVVDKIVDKLKFHQKRDEDPPMSEGQGWRKRNVNNESEPIIGNRFSQAGIIKTDKRDALGLANQLYNQLELGVQVADTLQVVRRAVPLRRLLPSLKDSCATAMN